MRKRIFVFVIALASGGIASAREESGGSAARRNAAQSVLLPKRIDIVSGVKFKTDGESASYSLNNGARFLFRDIEIRAAHKIPETGFNSRPEYVNPVFGLRFSLKDAAGIPLEIKGGNLDLGGSFKKLKNPLLPQNAYALPLQSYSAKGIGVFLPSFYAAQKPYAVSAEANVKRRDVFKEFGAAAFYAEHGVFAASTHADFRLGRRNSIGFSFTAARTNKKRNAAFRFGEDLFNSSSGKWNFCAQSAFLSSFYRASASVCVFEDVRGGWKPAYSFENSVKTGFFTLNAGVFYAPHKDTVTASLIKQRTSAQFRFNPQWTFYFSDDFIRVKTGALFLLEEKWKTARKKTLSAKVGIGTGIDFDKSSVRLNVAAENLTAAGSFRSLWERGVIVSDGKILEGASYAVGASFFQKSGLKTFCAASAHFYPKRGRIPAAALYKLSASVTLPSLQSYALSVQLSAGCSVKTKTIGGAADKTSAHLRAALKWRSGVMNVSCSAGIEYEIVGRRRMEFE
ncbi:MAG: hypothetical protein ACTTKL_06035 [Treponema sp.]